MLKKVLVAFIGMAVLVGLLASTLLLLTSAAPDEQTRQEIGQLVNRYYKLVSKGDIWPEKYRHLKELPEDERRRIKKAWAREVDEICAGEIGKRLSSVPSPPETAFAPMGEQKIDAEVKVLSVEDLRLTGPGRATVNAIIWSSIQMARYSEAE